MYKKRRQTRTNSNNNSYYNSFRPRDILTNVKLSNILIKALF